MPQDATTCPQNAPPTPTTTIAPNSKRRALSVQLGVGRRQGAKPLRYIFYDFYSLSWTEDVLLYFVLKQSKVTHLSSKTMNRWWNTIWPRSRKHCKNQCVCFFFMFLVFWCSRGSMNETSRGPGICFKFLTNKRHQTKKKWCEKGLTRCLFLNFKNFKNIQKSIKNQ